MRHVFFSRVPWTHLHQIPAPNLSVYKNAKEFRKYHHENPFIAYEKSLRIIHAKNKSKYIPHRSENRVSEPDTTEADTTSRTFSASEVIYDPMDIRRIFFANMRSYLPTEIPTKSN